MWNVTSDNQGHTRQFCQEYQLYPEIEIAYSGVLMYHELDDVSELETETDISGYFVVIDEKYWKLTFKLCYGYLKKLSSGKWNVKLVSVYLFEHNAVFRKFIYNLLENISNNNEKSDVNLKAY